MSSVDSTDVGATARAAGRLRTALRLLGNRQRLILVLLTLGRISVGFCDLLVAAAMYLLFLLLQGRAFGHHLLWTPMTVLSSAVITTVLVVLRGLMDLVSARSTFRQIQNLHTAFLLRLTEGYSRIEWGRFVERNRSELSARALQTTREAADFYHRCIEMTANIVIVAAMTAALVYQSLAAACALGFAVAAFYAGHRFLIRRRLQVAASSREVSLRLLQRNLADMFSSGKEIRTYGNHAFFQDRIRRQVERVAENNLHVVFLPQFARIVADQGAVLLFLFIVIAVELRQGDLTRLLSLLVFYFVLSRRLLPLISQISLLAGQMDGSYENVEIVDLELNQCRMHREVVFPSLLPDAGMVMQMVQVSFSFHGRETILRNVNLCMKEGETIVLHGASGIGKSSLLNLIAGVSRPLSGVIRVNRASIAYVPQEVPLLDDSIRNNLLFGLPQQSDEELMKALETARLDGFVSAQPLGLDSGVGDNGALFSGGERQRLGLARAILRGARLLLLDEATSALDEENQRQVLDNLSASGKAILLVTHRVHTRTFGHRVFRIEEGSLIEELNRELPTKEPDSPAVVSCSADCRCRHCLMAPAVHL
jgi:ABC-type multidrug transport system fused ATPase/permease subunit